MKKAKKKTIIELLNHDIENYGVEEVERRTCLKIKTITGIIQNSKKIRRVTIDFLYEYYHLERDKFYYENMKKWEPPTQSIIGSLLREKRHQKMLSAYEVAAIIKGDTRQIFRIEAGDSLPGYSSYYIQKFLDIYDFTDDERQKIQWFIVILKDVMEIYKNAVDSKGHCKEPKKK